MFVAGAITIAGIFNPPGALMEDRQQTVDSFIFARRSPGDQFRDLRFKLWRYFCLPHFFAAPFFDDFFDARRFGLSNVIADRPRTPGDLSKA